MAGRGELGRELGAWGGDVAEGDGKAIRETHDLVPDAAAAGPASTANDQPVRILRVKVARVKRVRERDLRAREHRLRHDLGIGFKGGRKGMSARSVLSRAHDGMVGRRLGYAMRLRLHRRKRV